MRAVARMRAPSERWAPESRTSKATCNTEPRPSQTLLRRRLRVDGSVDSTAHLSSERAAPISWRNAI
eukprot:12170143-Alexandrium_andersonii.AAC.1